MQKWEYMTVVFHVGESGALELFSVNGKFMGKEGMAILPEYAYPDLSTFLNSIGELGWELVGLGNDVAPRNKRKPFLVAKRPVE